MSDPAEIVLGLVRGAWRTFALRAACVLGVFDELADPSPRLTSRR